MINRIQDNPSVKGTKIKWYRAVIENCQRDSSTKLSVGSMGDSLF
jgi:hypothetical protein